MTRLDNFYKEECVPAMMQEFRYKSSMQVPRVKKIIVKYKSLCKGIVVMGKGINNLIGIEWGLIIF